MAVLTEPPATPVLWRAFRIVSRSRGGEGTVVEDTGKLAEAVLWYSAREQLVAETGLDRDSILVEREPEAA